MDDKQEKLLDEAFHLKTCLDKVDVYSKLLFSGIELVIDAIAQE